MSEDQLEDFAKGSRKGKPERVEREAVRFPKRPIITVPSAIPSAVRGKSG